MINLLEGVPGSGKSYEAVVYHVLPALKSGRKVITNLPLKIEAFQVLYPDLAHLIEVRRSPMPIYGKWDAEAANRGELAFVVGEFDEPRVKVQNECLYIDPMPDTRLFGSVWDFYTTWRGDGNVGPLYVIDECHVSFPKTKLRRKVISTPDEVIQWFKISRHFGADVLLMTQRMGALDEDIAGLAEFHVRVRKASFLGRPDHYIRKVFAGFRGGEISSDERAYEKQFFPLYQSHTQGAAVIEASASDVRPAHLKWKRASQSFFLVGALLGSWSVYRTFIAGKPKPTPQAIQTAPKSGLHPIPIRSPPAVTPAPLAVQVVHAPEAKKTEAQESEYDPVKCHGPIQMDTSIRRPQPEDQ